MKAAHTQITAPYLLTALLAGAVSAQSQYVAHDLGVIGQGPDPVRVQAFATAINNNGLIVGYSTFDGTYYYHPFTYQNGVRNDLGTLGGPFGEARAVNDAGVIVGSTTGQNGLEHACVYYQGLITDLGTLGGSQSWGYGINSSGVVVGYSLINNTTYRAFTYSQGHMTDIGTLGGPSASAQAINNSGVIVGSSYLNPTVIHAFSYNQGQMSDLGTLGGSFSQAWAINDSGMIIGSSSLSSGSSDHAFLYTAGHMIDLHTLGGADSVAFGINRTGTVVGESSTAVGASHAFVYSNGMMTDLAPILASAGFSGPCAANAIDDYGNIVGYGYIGEETHAFLLTIPEPGSANLLTFALLTMFCHARRVPRARPSP